MPTRYRPDSWSILTKIVALNLVVLFVAFLALVLYVLPLYERDLYQHRKDYLVDLVDMAVLVADSYQHKAADGELSLVDAQKTAVNTLRTLGRENGYYWVHDLQLKMIMHPYASSLEGNDLADYADPKGKRLFTEMNRTVAASGEGFVEYLWPKPGQQQPAEKISYVKLYRPWGWVIGSGMYLDDIAADVAALRSKVYITVVVLLLAIIMFSVVAAVHIKRPLQQSLALLKELPEQYRPHVETESLDEPGQLLKAMVKLVTNLKEAKEKAEAASNAKGRFLAQMSHEIRTPMHAISGLTELALNAADSPQQQELLGNIRHAADHLLSLVNQVLDFSKMESGAIELEQLAFDLRTTISAVILPFDVQIRAKGVTFLLSYAEELPTYVLGDPTRLRQVLVNLLGNAIKFTQQGQICLNVTKGEQQGEQFELRIAVQDTGVGIPQEKLEQIFTPYTQASASTTREFGGTGLGLSIVRQLLDVMHGSITVESQVGVGTCFHVVIPVSAADHDDLAHRLDIPEVAPRRVLLAEDSAVNRAMLAKLLEKAGHAVDTVADGRSAVEQWQTASYDLILMDIQMPEMDGLGASRAIRAIEEQQGGHVPIIAMTGQDTPEDAEACTRAGMDLQLKKPVQLCELLAAMGRVSS